MKNSKIFNLILLLVFSVLFMCGCANIDMIRRYNIVTDETGNEVTIIQDDIVVELDTSNSVVASKYSSILIQIQEDFDNYKLKVDTWKKSYEPDGSAGKTNAKYKYIFYGINVSLIKDYAPKFIIRTTFQMNSDYTYVGGGAENLFDLFYSNVIVDYGPFGDYFTANSKTVVKNESYNAFLSKNNIFESTSYINYIFDDDFKNGVSSYYDGYYKVINGVENTANSTDVSGLNLGQLFSTNVKIKANSDQYENITGSNDFYWNLSNKSLDYKLQIYNLIPVYSSWYWLALAVTFVFIVTIIIVYCTKFRRKIINQKLKVMEEEERRMQIINTGLKMRRFRRKYKNLINKDNGEME